MSRIGKKIIKIPSSVTLQINEKNIQVKGKYGVLEKPFLDYVSFQIENQEIKVLKTIDTKEAKAYHGLFRALLQNMILGVSEKFTRILVAEGVGYKFQLNQKEVILNMGYSHPIKIAIPDDLVLKIETPTKISITGIDKEKVGFLAAKIRDIRPPEPYKGKGISYEGEKIIRKAGKTGK